MDVRYDEKVKTLVLRSKIGEKTHCFRVCLGNLLSIERQVERRIKLDSEKKRRFNEVFVDPEHQMPRKVRQSFLPTAFLPRIIGRKKRKKSGFYVRRLTMIRATSANISLTRQKRILPVSRGNTRLPKICVAIDNFKSRCAKAICPTTFSANDH